MMALGFRQVCRRAARGSPAVMRGMTVGLLLVLAGMNLHALIGVIRPVYAS